eukprot:FR738466.1.p1 GENE.FR738466.1~~FR738466.1.p1  ORF type:complete len:123 (+),score=4.39 FR738466.1:26-370(+)
MATTFLSKQLVRLPEWCPCQVHDCSGGVMVTKSNEGRRVSCPCCKKSINVKTKAAEPDKVRDLQHHQLRAVLHLVELEDERNWSVQPGAQEPRSVKREPLGARRTTVSTGPSAV